jgi:histidinol-phosphate aminotransferase
MFQKKIVFLDRNENQYGPSPACLRAKKHDEKRHLYEYSRDYMEGRKSPLSYRLAIEYGLDEKNVILGYGAEDILKQVVHCYLGKGEKIMMPSMSWWYYKKIADEVGGVKVEYPILEGDDSFYYDIKGMSDAYHLEKPKIVLISSPNNPTGNRMDIHQMEQVLEEMKDTIVIFDEAYTLFFDSGKAYHGEFIKKYRNLIIIRTFSKYYALAGLRIGFALAGENHSLFTLFSARYLGFNRLSERIALAALDSSGYYANINRKISADMNMYFSEINKLPGFKAYRSYSNFILVKIPPEIKNELGDYLREHNMVIKFMDEDNLNSHIRITIGTQKQNERLINLLKIFLRQKHGLV